MASPRKLLAVGLLVDNPNVPAWVARIVGEIRASDYAEIAAVVVDRATADDGTPSRMRVPAWNGAIDGLLFGAFGLLDRLVFRAPDDPFGRIDLATDMPSAGTIETPRRTSGPPAWFGDPDPAGIRRLELDVILHFGSRTPRRDILDAARYGVWSYRHGGAARAGVYGGHGLFWDMYDRNTVSSVVLRIDGPGPRGGRVIYRSVGGVVPWSYSRNARYHYWRATSFVPRCLKILAEKGFPAIERLSEDDECPTRDRGRGPSNRDMLRFLPRHAALLARTAVRRCLRDESWFLVVNTGPRLADGCSANVARMKTHRAPPGRFWADPFPVAVGGQVWVFFEDYRFASKRAVISCAPVSADGALGDVSTVLERGYHFSWPFIFEHEGTLYMTPETWAEDRVELWRCRTFPDDWVLERVLIDGLKMSDPTIHRQDGKWWLFGAVSTRRREANDELHVFTSHALDGAWRPHPANPVVSDCRRARPAGRLFFRDGALIRPGQDCGGRYGRAITLNRVERLDPCSYAETTLGRIDGAWLPGNLGSHTLNEAGGLEFLDGHETVRKGA